MKSWCQSKAAVLTFELFGVLEQELVRVLHLQVKLDGLQQYSLQNHHLLLKEKTSAGAGLLKKGLNASLGACSLHES